jgi:PEGA domain
MGPTPVRPPAARAPSFEDGFGKRVPVVDRATGEALEYLCLRPELAALPAFVSAVRERIARFAGFDDPRFARVYRIEVLPPDTPNGPERLAVVSQRASGDRLAGILQAAEEHGLLVDVESFGQLVSQIVSAVARLHQVHLGLAHGSVGPGRIFVTPESGIMLVDYVYAPALEALNLSRDRMWQQFRLAIPPAAGRPRIDRSADALQIGLVALSLLLARAIREDEFPSRLPELIGLAVDRVPGGRDGEMGKPLRSWLSCALQLDPRHNFTSAMELDSALGEWLPTYTRPTAPLLVSPPVREALGSPPDDTSRVLEGIAEPLAQAPEPRAPVHVHSPAQATTTEGREARRPLFTVFSPPPTPSPAPAALRAPVPAKAPLRAERQSPLLKIGVGIAAAVLILAVGVPRAISYLHRPGVPRATAVVSIASFPEHVEMLLDGKRLGVTPLDVTVSAGTHSFEFRSDMRRRVIPMTLEPGEYLTQIVDLREEARMGLLEVRSEPPGAQVSIDGRVRGVSPLWMDLRAGTYTVLITNGSESLQRRVTLEPGRSVIIAAPLGRTPRKASPKTARR